MTGRTSLLLLLLLGASTASAAAPLKRAALSQVLRGEALERYEAARQDFKASRFQPALAGFVQAHRLSGDPRLLWNAAACLRKLERNAEALRTIDRYLSEGAELTAEEQEEARRAQLAVRALVAVVRLTTVPADVAISLDGTPLEGRGGDGVYVEPGRHAFHFSRAGLQDQLRQEGLKAGEEVSWTIELMPVPLAVQVKAAPAPVELQVAPSPPRARWAPWLVVGGGAAVGILGGVFLGTSSASWDRLRRECGTICSPQRWAGSRDLELAGVVLVAAGVAAIGVGIGWWALGGEPAARLTLGPTQVSLEVRF